MKDAVPSQQENNTLIERSSIQNAYHLFKNPIKPLTNYPYEDNKNDKEMNNTLIGNNLL